MTFFEPSEIPVQWVNISDIPIEPGPYCMSFGFEVEPLVRSIERIGLINSPLLASAAGRFEIITGYRRIVAWKTLGRDMIPCRVLPSHSKTPLELFCINLHENLCVRSFNPVEIAMILSRMSSWLEQSDIRKHYMPILGLSSRDTTLDFYLDLDRKFDNDIKKAVAQGDLSLYSAARFIEMDSESRDCLFQSILKLKLNVNQQKYFIDYIIDISYNYNQKIFEVLNMKSLQEIDKDPHMNNPQKAHAALRILKTRLFPRLTEAEESFNRTMAALSLPEGVRITAPAGFEGPHYRMELLFSDGKELCRKISALSGIDKLGGLEAPWEQGS